MCLLSILKEIGDRYSIMSSAVEWKTFKRDDQFLYSDDSTLKYDELETGGDKIVNRGQRKLAMTMLQLLNLYANSEEKITVLYVGAAPGVGIGFVSRLYPQIEWHLYDPRDFIIKSNPNIRIYTGDDGFFTDENANEWAEATRLGRKVIFVSDIRGEVPRGRGTTEKRERAIWADMLDQQRWVTIIRPMVAQLKFRLSFPGIRFSDEMDDKTTRVPYLIGIPFLQCWAGPTSAESRLVITSPDNDEEYPMTKWDLRKHEEQMFFHNIVRRTKYRYLNPLTSDQTPIFDSGLSNTWDSLLEYLIFNDYLEVAGAGNRHAKILALNHLLTTTLAH